MMPTAAELLRVGPIELFNRLEIVLRYVFGDLFTQYGSANTRRPVMKTCENPRILYCFHDVIRIRKRHRRSGCRACQRYVELFRPKEFAKRLGPSAFDEGMGR